MFFSIILSVHSIFSLNVKKERKTVKFYRMLILHIYIHYTSRYLTKIIINYIIYIYIVAAATSNKNPKFTVLQLFPHLTQKLTWELSDRILYCHKHHVLSFPD